MISQETFDVLVDGPTLNILPQRVPIRCEGFEQGGVEAVLEQILAALVENDGAAEPAALSQLSPERLLLLAADATDGLFSPVTSQSLARQVVPLSRLRLIVADDSVAADGDVSPPPTPQVVAQVGQEVLLEPMLPDVADVVGVVDPSVAADGAVDEVAEDGAPAVRGIEVEPEGEDVKQEADVAVADAATPQQGHDGGSTAEGNNPTPTAEGETAVTSATNAAEDDSGAAALCVEEPVLSVSDSIVVMLQVVRLVVADAVASTPPEYCLTAQTLSELRSAALSNVLLPGVRESGSAVDPEISVAFHGAILSGVALGVSNRPRGPSAEVLALQSTIAQLMEQKSLLESRLTALLTSVDTSAAVRIATPKEAAAPEPEALLSPATDACPDPPLVPEDDDGRGANMGYCDAETPAPASHPLLEEPQRPVAPPSSSGRQHTDAAAHMSDDNNARAQPSTDEGSVGAVAVAVSEGAVSNISSDSQNTVDSVLNYTMVTCFYNHFDYVNKTTRKKGRALSLASTGKETRYDVLRRAVKETFGDELDIAFFDASGARQVISSDAQLTSVLLQAKSTGERPIFQCFSLAQEAEEQERAEIGSSPKQIFTRTPTPPASTVTAGALAGESPLSSRPVSRPSSRQVAATNLRTPSLPTSRPSSARQSTPATALPFDYIAGNPLTDDAIAREFDVVARGGDSVSRDDVLLYLNARYDTIGHPNRFEQLYRSLFGRRKANINVHEFAIILLRLSQS